MYPHARILLLCIVVTISNSAHAKDISKSADHPLLSRYPGSEIITYVNVDFDDYLLPLGLSPASKNKIFDKSQKISGAITRIGYQLKKTTSTKKIITNFATALAGAGFVTLYSCEGKDCGVPGGWQKFFTNSQVWGIINSQKLIVTKKSINSREVYIVVFCGEQSERLTYQIDVIETQEMQTNLVQVNADDLLQRLTDDGKVALYGIQFDFDKATLKPESDSVLQVIASVLEKDKSLHVYIVGHTDDTGALSHNIELSQLRAKAVVTELQQKYGIESSRLMPFGAGPYAPVGNNATEDGQQKNRRVEIVKHLLR